MVCSVLQSEFETHVTGDSVSVYAYYGQDRTRERKALMEHDIVLTTYGVVASEFNQQVLNPLLFLHISFSVFLAECFLCTLK